MCQILLYLVLFAGFRYSALRWNYNCIYSNYNIQYYNEEISYSFCLICLYLLVQVIREILEAKFLSSKLEIHPLVILLSLYIGVNLFGILGILAGPMYSI